MVLALELLNYLTSYLGYHGQSHTCSTARNPNILLVVTSIVLSILALGLTTATLVVKIKNRSWLHVAGGTVAFILILVLGFTFWIGASGGINWCFQF